MDEERNEIEERELVTPPAERGANLPLTILLGLILLLIVIGAMMGTFVSYFESVLQDLAPHS